VSRWAYPVLLWAILAGSPLPAQDWAERMFKETRHDFGTIARGAKAEYRFVLENNYLDDVHIARIRTSCGCTTPRIEQQRLKTYEKGAVVARINSDKFVGRQQSTITVTIDEPLRAQVQLHVKVYIQSDVTLEPASVVLGDIDRGTAAEKAISVRYTGRGDWKIVEVKSNNPHLTAEAVESKRSSSRVSYHLRVRLDEDAPPGYIKEHLLLVTAGGRTKEILVLVEGQVLPDLIVSPNSLFLGVVRPGERVTKQVVVRSKRPFRITSISGDCECLRFNISDDAAKRLHLIPVTFIACDKPGKVAPVIHLHTDLDGATADISAYAAVSSDR